ncbi:MAG: agmatine deiminase family protein [Gammaproteobacteria bacterium]|nr:agmatine deiminase family protein [Gammaproteobacteria bacterium]
MARRIAAEWAAQDAVMMTWPHERSDWRFCLKAVEVVFCDIARHISQRQLLLISCLDDAVKQHAEKMLSECDADLSRVRFYLIPTDDTWVRDYGPVTIFDGHQPWLLDFIFNGWGNKFDAHQDNCVTQRLHAQRAFASTPVESVPLVLEGGSIDTDGCGTLLTTEQCLLSVTRNPDYSRADIEQQLKKLFGVERVLWLRHGHLVGDDTDGHIDTLARFCSPDTICYVACDDPDDEHYAELERMKKELQIFRTRDNRPYRLLPLPWPQAQYGSNKQRLPATYANFLIINGAVLLPTYDDPADEQAKQVVRDCFPGREIIPIPCLPLLSQSGSLHCLTMQIAAGVVNPLSG